MVRRQVLDPVGTPRDIPLILLILLAPIGGRGEVRGLQTMCVTPLAILSSVGGEEKELTCLRMSFHDGLGRYRQRLYVNFSTLPQTQKRRPLGRLFAIEVVVT